MGLGQDISFRATRQALVGEVYPSRRKSAGGRREPATSPGQVVRPFAYCLPFPGPWLQKTRDNTAHCVPEPISRHIG